MDSMNKFFASAFGLPWRRGNHDREYFGLNPSCVLPPSALASSLPEPYSMKAVHIMGARPDERIFFPSGEDYADETQAAVTGAAVGNGHLVYCGDANAEEGSKKIILSMCGFSGQQKIIEL